MPPALERAREDRHAGRLWLARQRLASFIAIRGYDQYVLEELGEVCWEMGDQFAAGRYWFFTELKTTEKQEAVALFLQHARASSDRRQLVLRWPAALRRVPPHRLPPEVRDRFLPLVPFVAARPTRPTAPRRTYTSTDLFVSSASILLGLFFLYCFSVGFAHVVGLK